MAEVASAYVSLLPSLKGFGKSVSNQIGGDLDRAGVDGGKRFGKGMSGGIGGMAGKMFAPLAAGIAAIGIGSFFKDAVAGASDLGESASKVGVVFGKQFAPQIIGASKTAAKAMGLSQNAYLAATGTLGNLLVSLDIAPKAAAGMSQSMVKLAGDLASFNNVSPEEALAAIKSGLTGETEPLKAFGVNMNDATLKAQALKMHLIKTTKEAMDPQTKALAAQALIMAQTGTAQGDFARTSGGLANQQRILAAQFEDVKTKIGGALLPAVTKVTTAFNGLLTGVMDSFAKGGISQVFTDIGAKVTAALPGIKTKLGEMGTAFVAWIQEALPPMLVKLGELLVKLETWIFTVYWPAIAAKLVQAGKAFVEWIVPMIPPMLAKLGDLLVQLGNWLLTTALPAIGTKLKEWGLAFVKWIAPMIPPILLALGGLLLKLGGWLLGTALPAIVGKLAEWALAFAKWVPGAAVSLIGKLGGLLVSLGGWILTTALPAIISKLAQWALAFLKWVADAIGSLPGKLAGLLGVVVSWAASVPGKIVSAMGDLGSLLFNKGKEIIQGLIDGIRSMVGNIGSAMGDVMGKIAGFLPGSPVKEGPLRVLNNGYAGGQIVKMLAGGIDSQQATLDAQMRGLVSIPRVGSLDFASSSARSAAVAGGAGSDALLTEVQGLRAETQGLRSDVRGLVRDYQMTQRQYL